MKTNIKNILIVIGIIACATTAVASSPIQAYISDNILYYKGEISKSLQYPLLNYNDNTYISVRDMANLLRKDVEWSEKNQTIYFISKTKKPEQNAVKESETALAIGKALAGEYFSDRITEKTAFKVYYSKASPPVDDLWQVFVKFEGKDDILEGSNILEDNDALIQINPITGSFCITDFQADEDYRTVVDTGLLGVGY